MTFELKDTLYLVGIVVSTVVSFLSTRHKMKEYVRDKFDENKEQLNNLKLEVQTLKSKDDLQQQVLDQIGKQMDSLIPKLMEELSHKNSKK